MIERLADQPRFALCARLFAEACEASREHERKAGEALAAYGSQGPLVSGCVRSHFPEAVKEELRRLARLVSDKCDAARLARPARVRHDTLRRLAQEIATRDGSGRYGPQPFRPGR
jgi:hypothetical protein